MAEVIVNIDSEFEKKIVVVVINFAFSQYNFYTF